MVPSQSPSMSSSSSEEEEDEDGALLTDKVQEDIFRVLSLIKSKDQSIYDPSRKFFDEGEEELAGGRGSLSCRLCPLLLG